MIIWFTTHYSIFIFGLFLDVIGQIVLHMYYPEYVLQGYQTKLD